MDVFVARQAIFDRARELYAYELLFRSGNWRNEFDGTDATSATTQVVANCLFSIGLERILSGAKAFVNFDRNLLIGGLLSALPPDTTVVEILETVEPDEEVVAACRNLRKLGYRIALDDFVFHPRFEPLIRIATFIKVDIRTTSKQEQERLLRTYKPLGIEMLAEKVETLEEFEWAQHAGYDLFQGYFFARPVIVRGSQVPQSRVACLRLLAEMQEPDLDFGRLETAVCEDVSLAYKLFRYVNSALFYRSVDVHSIGHALTVLGESGIRHWVALCAIPALAKDKPGELITHALVRARFCERLAELAGVPRHNLAFLIGLFSLLDALLDLPLAEALDEANVASVIRCAILGTPGEDDALRKIYRLARQYEIGDWDGVGALAQEMEIEDSDVAASYAESILWAQQALHPQPAGRILPVAYSASPNEHRASHR